MLQFYLILTKNCRTDDRPLVCNKMALGVQGKAEVYYIRKDPLKILAASIYDQHNVMYYKSVNVLLHFLQEEGYLSNHSLLLACRSCLFKAIQLAIAFSKNVFNAIHFKIKKIIDTSVASSFQLFYLHCPYSGTQPWFKISTLGANAICH